jgi:hypothetical protein
MHETIAVHKRTATDNATVRDERTAAHRWTAAVDDRTANSPCSHWARPAAESTMAHHSCAAATHRRSAVCSAVPAATHRRSAAVATAPAAVPATSATLCEGRWCGAE